MGGHEYKLTSISHHKDQWGKEGERENTGNQII